MSSQQRERPKYLVLVFIAPTIWAVHFLLSYITTAVWCARFAGESGSLGPARIAVAVYTLIALGGLAVVGAGAWRRHDHPTEKPPHDADTAEDRSRFLGFAALLLSGLSAIATIYVAMGAVMIDSCR